MLALRSRSQGPGRSGIAPQAAADQGRKSSPGEAAIVRTAWVAVRGEPSQRAELVSQWLCGETVRIVEAEDGWIRCRGEDGYEGWTPLAPLLRVDPATADAWSASATARSIGATLRALPDAGGEPPDSGPGPSVPATLPWGARVRPGGHGSIQLPDGSRARPVPAQAVVTTEERATRFPRERGAVVDTARRWLGVPYLWGGRTESGVDCSGLIQSVFGLHGVDLPRDSHQQCELGSGGAAERAVAEPGDLIFFAPEGREVSHVGICVGGERILHSAASNGAVAIDDLSGSRELERRLRASIVTVIRPL